MANKQSEVRHYFIDEGGDSTLFSRGGRVLIGSKGCSRFFVPGLLDVPDPMALQCSLEDLRKQLLENPYFRDVPSMQAEKRKTARSQFAQKHGIAIGASLQVFEFSPSEQAGLQAVDYFTWAIQRLYERHEERYEVSWGGCSGGAGYRRQAQDWSWQILYAEEPYQCCQACVEA